MLWAHGVGSAECGAGDVCLTTEVEHDSDGRPWDWLLVYLARGVASGPSYLRRLLLALQYPSRFSGLLFPYNPPFPPHPLLHANSRQKLPGMEGSSPHDVPGIT